MQLLLIYIYITHISEMERRILQAQTSSSYIALSHV